MAFGISGGLISPTVQQEDSFFPDDYNEGMGRYVELLDLQKAAYEEQAYWIGVYERAQQLGIRGFTIQEILLQLQKVSQRLQNFDSLLSASAQEKLQFDGNDLRNIANDISDNGGGR